MSVTPRGRILTEHAQKSLLRHGFKEPFDLVDDIIDSCTHQTRQRHIARSVIWQFQPSALGTTHAPESPQNQRCFWQFLFSLD
jgi:hypothetical protein